MSRELALLLLVILSLACNLMALYHVTRAQRLLGLLRGQISPRRSPPAPVPRFEGSNVNPRPTYARPQAPPTPPSAPRVPPMADMVYGCDEHYYDGCPNCGRGRRRRGPGQPDDDPAR